MELNVPLLREKDTAKRLSQPELPDRALRHPGNGSQDADWTAPCPHKCCAVRVVACLASIGNLAALLDLCCSASLSGSSARVQPAAVLLPGALGARNLIQR